MYSDLNSFFTCLPPEFSPVKLMLSTRIRPILEVTFLRNLNCYHYLFFQNSFDFWQCLYLILFNKAKLISHNMLVYDIYLHFESESHWVMSDSLWPHEIYNPWNSPGQNTGVGKHSLLQRIFPTQGLNTGLLHCRRILYHLSHHLSENNYSYLAWFCIQASTYIIYFLIVNTLSSFSLWTLT